MKKFSFALFLCFLTAIFAFAQQTDEDDVVKITTKLVQLDAVVTDAQGNQVTDLTAADFEVLQDGKPQKISNFSYINTAAVAPVGSNAPTEIVKTNKNATLPPVPVRPSVGGRLLTFIVDDGNCSASRAGMTASREALEKFVNRQMLPNDMVAIYQTRGGSSLLQQYTSDKEQLLRVVRKINWYPGSGACNNTGEIFEAARADVTVSAVGGGQKSFETEQDKKRREAAEDANRDAQITGILGVVRYIVRGLERVGGRKVVFLLSDGISIVTRDNQILRTQDALRDLTEAANRASVVFNTIDVRGLLDTSMIEARDEILTKENPTATDETSANRARDVRNSQNGLFFLANETGGNFYKNQNYLDVPISRALSLEKGYYLLAYEPDDETFKGKNFNKVEIKVKRPELKVISRAGFLGKTDDATKPKKRAGDSELYEAVTMPLPRAGLNLQLTAFFGNTPAEGNFVRSLVHLDGGELTFTDDSNGTKKVSFDVFAVTLNEKGEVVDEFNRTHTVNKIAAAQVQLIKQNGLIYAADVPIKKAGTYSFRMAVRDAASRQLGTASQVVQVPELKKDKIHLSGLTVSEVDASGKFVVPSAVKTDNAISAAPTTAVPAIRRFRRGTALAYAYTLYNAALDKATSQPKLTIQVNLYRDGKTVVEGQPQTAQLEKQNDWTRIGDYGYLRLNQNMQPGDYVLQVTVKDLLTNQTTSQWIDFQVN